MPCTMLRMTPRYRSLRRTLLLRHNFLHQSKLRNLAKFSHAVTKACAKLAACRQCLARAELLAA